ncbi:hypothetical protein RND71_042317 [Anisodus tanguticus]|uniref:Uncharacterized protein n=1 Tax=Anisodus tanguticus TaxID=243964 RepID=A0AAE1QQQ3_9SOLA|nr:hypothetical protein RND71_042317 [Anisodus tanguticus]
MYGVRSVVVKTFWARAINAFSHSHLSSASMPPRGEVSPSLSLLFLWFFFNCFYPIVISNAEF